MLNRFFTPAPDSLMNNHRLRGKSRWLYLLNLCWVMWVFGDLLFSPQHVGRWWIAVTAVSLALFFLLYALSSVRPLREIVVYGLALAVVGFLTMPINHSGGSTYIIFACAMLAFRRTAARSFALIGLVLLGFALEGLLLQWPWWLIGMMSMVSIAVGGGNVAYWESRKKEAELRLSHDEVRRLAATAERERIGRDLHDLLGHTLSLITLKLELSRKLFDRDHEQARRELAEAESVARHALAEVRSAVSGFRAADLAGELASARLLLESAGVHLDYTLPIWHLPLEVERSLSLVLREAVTNIARHAHAACAQVQFEQRDAAVQLCVNDDGRGGVVEDGNGLRGMRERVHAVGGSLSIESRRAHGTRLCVTIPFEADPGAATDVLRGGSGDALPIPTASTEYAA